MRKYETKMKKLCMLLSIMEEDLEDEITLDNHRVVDTIAEFKFSEKELEKVHKIVNNWTFASGEYHPCSDEHDVD